MRAEMVRSYVETLLEGLTGQPKMVPDADGDYPVRYRSAQYFVRLVGETHPVVQVFSIAVEGVEDTEALLRSLNSINADIRFARVLWTRNQVLVEADLVGSSIDQASFGSACQAVATISDAIGPRLAKEHGGRPAFTEDAEPKAIAEAVAEGPTGFYL